jgi:hypothetical protein
MAAQDVRGFQGDSMIGKSRVIRAIIIYASSVLALSLLAATLKVLDAEFVRALLEFPAWLIVRLRDTPTNTFVWGLILYPVMLLPLLAFLLSGKKRWLVVQVLIVAIQVVSFFLWLTFVFDMPHVARCLCPP